MTRASHIVVLLALALPGASFAAGTESACPVSEEALIGNWQSESGGFFQEMAFEYHGPERVFNSWLHERPEISDGMWTFENCTIFMRHATEEALQFSYRIVRVDGDRIYLQDVEDQGDAVYRRIGQ